MKDGQPNLKQNKQFPNKISLREPTLVFALPALDSRLRSCGNRLSVSLVITIKKSYQTISRKPARIFVCRYP